MTLRDTTILTEMIMLSVRGRKGTKTKVCKLDEANRKYGGLEVEGMKTTVIPVKYKGKIEMQYITAVTLKGSQK